MGPGPGAPEPLAATVSSGRPQGEGVIEKTLEKTLGRGVASQKWGRVNIP